MPAPHNIMAAAIGLLVRHMMRPPTADELYQNIHRLHADGDSGQLLDAERQVKQFFELYEGDPRTQEIRAIQEEINLRRNIQNQRNIYDEWQLKTKTIQAAVKIVASFFLGGYSTEDLRSLQRGLNILGLKDRPGRSIQRLVKGLEDAGSLAELEDKIQIKKVELKMKVKICL